MFRQVASVPNWRLAFTALEFDTVRELIRPWSFRPLPTLTRLILILIILGGIGYGTVYALANFVQPHEREIEVRIKRDGFGR